MPRQEKKFHFIYKTTNLLTGRYYIGMHSTCNLEDGYMGSGRRLRHSINKYGVENHKREILEFLNSREELIAREIEVVTLDLIAKEDCMNLREGGTGGFSIEQQKLNAAKSKEVQKELHQNPEWLEKKKQKISDKVLKAYDEGRKEKTYFYNWDGKTHTDDTKQKLSEVMKGKGLGKNNSQFGTMWITNGEESKKINKESPIPTGWVKGRLWKIF